MGGSRILLACCAACGFRAPVDHAGGPDADPGPAIDAPDEPTTDATDAPIAPGDRDGDGVPDGSDLCPDDPDPLQHDHDADARGDVCDRCPHLAEPADPDQDGDGVGDACDPRPGSAGDQRALWLGFYDSDAATVAGWSGAGSWSLAGGWYRETGTSTSGFDYRGPSLAIARAYLASAIRLDAVDGTTWNAGILAGLQGTPPSSATRFYECFTLSGGASPFAEAQAAGFGDNQVPRPSVPVGGVTTIVLDLTAGLQCTFSDGAGWQANTSLNSGQTAGRIILTSQRGRVSFDYVFAVDVGP